MTDQRFWVLHGLLPAVLFLPLALMFEHTSLDFWVANHFYDSVSKTWIGASTWWAKDLIHEGGRHFVTIIGLSAFALSAASQRFDRLQAWRRPALFVGVSVVACTALVALLKHYSNVDCPEDLLRYGGEQLYVHVFSNKPDSAARGACFPGGHSSGAFSLVAFYFLTRELRAPHARWTLFGVMALGSIYALGQWTRGEHLPSHDAWSMVICWYVSLTIYAAAFHRRVWGEARRGLLEGSGYSTKPQ